MNETIESNTILEVTDDKGEINLTKGFKCTVIVTDPRSPILNTPYSTVCVFYEIKVRN